MSGLNWFPETMNSLKLSPDDSLLDDLEGKWSDWATIMCESQEFAFKKRGSVTDEIGNKIPLKGYRLQRKNLMSAIPDAGGIYQLALEPNCELAVMEVVYLGRAKSLQQRMLLYCYNGSHKREKIEYALDQGCQIHVRFVVTPNWKTLEAELLNRYKGQMQWNIQTPNLEYDDEDECIQKLLFHRELLSEGPVNNIEGKNRDSTLHADSLLEDWDGKWSCWFQIITQPNPYMTARSGVGSRIPCKNLKSILALFNKGLYELGICLTLPKFPNQLPLSSVVYMGRANANIGQALYDRINQICANGMYPGLATKINEVVGNGYSIYARVLGKHDAVGNLIPPDLNLVRTQVLQKYLYNWLQC